VTYTVVFKGKKRAPNAPTLSMRQRLALRITGKAYVGHNSKPGWSGALPFYAFECPTHGVVSNYPMGYEKRLECPKCLEENLEMAR
jgi:hypothetical protein